MRSTCSQELLNKRLKRNFHQLKQSVMKMAFKRFALKVLKSV